jgi:hypothetical protein
MNASSVPAQDSVFKRVLLLYRLFMLLSNAAYLIGYYLLPEGFLRGGPSRGRPALLPPLARFGRSLRRPS